MILKLDDIHVYYGAIHAVKGVSLEVNEGEIVALIGANGAGVLLSDPSYFPPMTRQVASG